MLTYLHTWYNNTWLSYRESSYQIRNVLFNPNQIKLYIKSAAIYIDRHVTELQECVFPLYLMF